jgi:hypothetical protein
MHDRRPGRSLRRRIAGRRKLVQRSNLRMQEFAIDLIVISALSIPALILSARRLATLYPRDEMCVLLDETPGLRSRPQFPDTGKIPSANAGR